MYIEKDKYDCSGSLSGALIKGKLWRLKLADQYSDYRNDEAAALLAKLAHDAPTLSDSCWMLLRPHFESCPAKWREALSATVRLVGFKSRIKDLPTFVSALLHVVASQNAVHVNG